MSVRFSDKCTKDQAREFLLEVKNWCDENGIKYAKIKGLTGYEGEVRLYNGQSETYLSRRRVRQKDEMGYFLQKKKIKKPSYTSVYRDEWYSDYREDEQQAIRSFFSKLVE
jgi:hypothetical protein